MGGSGWGARLSCPWPSALPQPQPSLGQTCQFTAAKAVAKHSHCHPRTGRSPGWTVRLGRAPQARPAPLQVPRGRWGPARVGGMSGGSWPGSSETEIGSGPPVPSGTGRTVGAFPFGCRALWSWWLVCPPPRLSFSGCRRRGAGPTTARLVPQLGGVLRLGGTCPFPRDLPCSPSPSCTSPYYAPTVCRALSAWGQR